MTIDLVALIGAPIWFAAGFVVSTVLLCALKDSVEYARDHGCPMLFKQLFSARALTRDEAATIRMAANALRRMFATLGLGIAYVVAGWRGGDWLRAVPVAFLWMLTSWLIVREAIIQRLRRSLRRGGVG